MVRQSGACISDWIRGLHMKIAICEDERYWTEALKSSISKWAVRRGIKICCSNFVSPKKLTSHLETHADVDVLFLDISLGEEVTDGMALAKRIRRMGLSLPIIFVTVDALRAVDGYLVQAMGFLTKPVDENRLTLFLDRIVKQQCAQDSIQIMSDGYITNIYPSDIVYVEVIDHTVIYHLIKGLDNVTLRGTLGEVLILLDGYCFVQIHRSYIVAVDKINRVKTTHPHSVNLLKTGEMVNLPVSRKYINHLLEAYSDSVWEGLI